MKNIRDEPTAITLSIWTIHLAHGFERGWISGGGLQRYIEEDGLKGVQSSFQGLRTGIEIQKYDRDFTTLAQQGISQTAQSDYDYLIARDLQLAADLLKPVQAQTQGAMAMCKLICRLRLC